MEFEGPEKKLEILCTGIDLLSFPESFWSRVVLAANAQIISKIRNEKQVAYLLSESSLFIIKNRILLITCGQTQLVKALPVLLEKIATNDISYLIYERKNEFFPQKQPMSFEDDVRILSEFIDGNSYTMGEERRHHISVYASNKQFKQQENDNTLEILMHGMSKRRCRFFSQFQSIETVHKELPIEDILPGFKIDAFAFNPCGYSLNAIRDEYYFTIHITPQSPCTYTSFETNYFFGSDQDLMNKTINHVLSIFEPDEFNLLYFDSQNILKTTCLNQKLNKYEETTLKAGYVMQFAEYLPDREREQ